MNGNISQVPESSSLWITGHHYLRDKRMPDVPAQISKKLLRDEARQKRSFITPVDREQHSACICEHALSLINGSETVMVYVAKFPEVNTSRLIDSLLERGVRIVVPIIERATTSLRLSYLEDPSVLVESTFHVPEPVGNELPAHAEDVDMVLIPVLAFDRRGNRLGYGAGYYDRFLAANPDLRKVGLAYSCQEAGAIPADENDIRMDIIITEKDVIRCDG